MPEIDYTCVRTSPLRDTSREVTTLLIHRLLRQYLFMDTLGTSAQRHVKLAYKKGVFRAFKVPRCTHIGS
jgi:hypothetical protein